MIPNDQLDALEVLLEKATDGPWQVLEDGCIHRTGDWQWDGTVPPEKIICTALGWDDGGRPKPSLQIEKDDAKFIAAVSPPVVRDLIEEIRWLRASNHVLKDAQLRTYDGLVQDVHKYKEALEYYAHPDHYEETVRINGTRPPGVLVERGRKAREALGKLNKEDKRYR